MPDRSLFDPPLHQDTDLIDAHAPRPPAPWDPEHMHYAVMTAERPVEPEPILLNGFPLNPTAHVTVRRTIDRGSGAWVNGWRLYPGDRLEWDGELLHVEPFADFRDPGLPERDEDGA